MSFKTPFPTTDKRHAGSDTEVVQSSEVASRPHVAEPSVSRQDRRRTLNIAIVSHAYYPQFGGVSEHVHHISEELRKRGHSVTIITCNHKNSNSCGESPPIHGGGSGGNNVLRVGSNLLVPYNGAHVNLTVGWNVYGKMRRLFRDGSYDVVHVHCPLVPVLPLAATRTSRAPVLVGTFHASSKSSAGYLLFRKILKKYHRKLDGRIAVSVPARDFVSRYFGGEYRIIPNGVDPTRFHPDREPIGELADGTLNVLFVGRPDPRKGLEHLIRAMGIVKTRTKIPCRLVIVGDGPERKAYEKMVAPSLREAVRFVGSVPLDVVPRYFASAHVFCSPATRNESFGIVLLEAMASGVPVVASDIPGYRSVVSSGREGLLVRPGDEQTLADAILTLLRDRDLRREMGTTGRNKALDYSWERIAQRTEAYYEEILVAKGLTESAAPRLGYH
ncbi:MAG: glycosyltransferase family 4 protein [Candidatus Eisenbacteria bacterium]